MAVIHHRDPSVLKDSDSPLRFLIQGLALWIFFPLYFLLVLRAVHASHYGIVIFAAAFFLAAAIADFFSGIFHWGLDTWGTVETPVFGKKMIRDFRVHHIDEKDITMHGVIPTIGPTAVGVIIFEFIALFIPLSSPAFIFLCALVSSLGFWTVMTNQFHKWAHMDHEKIPAIPRFFQKIGLMLAPAPHHVHHVEPFTQSYCITTGWWNPLLTKWQFFRHLEKVVVRLTGAVPRADDIGIEAATELAKEEHILP